ncbi:hypothetical protein DZS_48250 [Dickeya ananatis]
MRGTTGWVAVVVIIVVMVVVMIVVGLIQPLMLIFTLKLTFKHIALTTSAIRPGTPPPRLAGAASV